ncbi:MAG: sensor histidine kinase [Clostridia bacterium]|nr:sensor histidine kinase [Clostridia bacterium]
MKRIPLWGKYYIFYIIGILITILIIVSSVMYKTYSEKRDIISTDAKNIVYFAETELSNRLKNVEERFGGVEIARSFLIADKNFVVGNYKHNIQSLVETLCADSREVLSVFYVDNKGNNYSAGEAIGGLAKRLELMENARRKEVKHNKKNVWFYDSTDKGDHACVLYRDIVYVNDNFEKQYLGSMLVYVDSGDINRDYFSGVQVGTGILFVDDDGVIVISTDNEAVGQKYDEYFSRSGNNISDSKGNVYACNESESMITGWRSVSYFSTELTAKQSHETLVLLISLTLMCMVLMAVFSYFITKRLGKPINELVKSITVLNDGHVMISDDLNRDEAERIKAVFDDMTQKLVEQTELNHQKEMQLQISLLKSYEYQMNPHFLFNTLQIIQMLSVIGRNEDVNNAVTCLGNMLRFNLSSENEVTLREEADNVENYFRILKYRYNNDFTYKVIVDESLYSCKTLKFMLQPFVENSIKHGLQNKQGTWEIAIVAEKINDELAIVIKDNGVGIEPQRLADIKASLSKTEDTTMGIGIKNVNSRIKLTYGDKYGVDVFSNSGTQILVHIPCIREVKDDV